MLDYADGMVSHCSQTTCLIAIGWDWMEVGGYDVSAAQVVQLQMKVNVAGKPKVLIARTPKINSVSCLENALLSNIFNHNPEFIDSLMEKNQ
ncbi:MAG: hypothetical protein ACYDBH_02660 [Acidobacteriaceae bacterium]